MNADDKSNLADAEAALFLADRELGQRAFEVVIARRFPEYTELVRMGVGRNDPHLIYRGGESFLVVDTDISDPLEENANSPVRKLPDGRTVERGTREYLSDAVQATIEDRTLAAAIIAALSGNRVRYILVTVNISGSANQREVESVELSEFEI